MNNEKLSLDDALEFILNGDDSELESLSEDFDAEDFDVPAVVTDDLENTLFGEVLRPEKEMNEKNYHLLQNKKIFQNPPKKAMFGKKRVFKT